LLIEICYLYGFDHKDLSLAYFNVQVNPYVFSIVFDELWLLVWKVNIIFICRQMLGNGLPGSLFGYFGRCVILTAHRITLVYSAFS